MSNRPRLEKEKKEPKNSKKEKMTEDSQWRRRPRGLPGISGHSPVAVHRAFSSPLATFPALPCIAALPFCNFSPSFFSQGGLRTLIRYTQQVHTSHRGCPRTWGERGVHLHGGGVCDSPSRPSFPLFPLHPPPRLAPFAPPSCSLMSQCTF